MNERRLDVSRLEPCEPLEQTLAAVRELRPGEYLRVTHRREPHLLFPLLDELGCDWDCRPGGAGAWEILIWRGDDPAAVAAVGTLPGR